jgi:hypothetical protein
MGTRSLTVFLETNNDNTETEIAVLYRQFDGYPEEHGHDLANLLEDMVMVNGMTSGQPKKIANGMGCLTAQVVAHFKTEPGNFYLYPAGTREVWEEYIYEIRGKTGEHPTITIKVPRHAENGNRWELIGYNTIFKGTAGKFLLHGVEEESESNMEYIKNE